MVREFNPYLDSQVCKPKGTNPPNGAGVPEWVIGDSKGEFVLANALDQPGQDQAGQDADSEHDVQILFILLVCHLVAAAVRFVGEQDSCLHGALLWA